MGTVAQLQPGSGNFVAPMMISIACMVGTCLVIVAYHLLLVRYCLARRRRRQQQQLIAEEILARRNLAAALSSAADETGLPLGVEERILKTIPIIPYSGEMDQRECAVCLGELEEGEAVRLLPSCQHAFHIPCIDQWFLGHSSCPVCRAPVVAPPVATDDHNKPSAPGGGGSAGRVPPERSSRVGLLRHCVSFVMPQQLEGSGLLGDEETGLKRSVSLTDSSGHLIIDIERKQEKATTSSSSSSSSSSSCSSSQEALVRSDLTRSNQAMSSLLLRPFSQLGIGRTGCGIDGTGGDIP